MLPTTQPQTGWPRHSFSLSNRAWKLAVDSYSLSQWVSTYLLSYQGTAHATTGEPPCKLFLQRNNQTRFGLLQPDYGRIVLDKQSLQKSHNDQRCKNLSVGTYSLTRTWLDTRQSDGSARTSYLHGQDRWRSNLERQIKDWVNPDGPPSGRVSWPEVSHRRTHLKN